MFASTTQYSVLDCTQHGLQRRLGGFSSHYQYVHSRQHNRNILQRGSLYMPDSTMGETHVLLSSTAILAVQGCGEGWKPASEAEWCQIGIQGMAGDGGVQCTAQPQFQYKCP